MDPVRRAEKHAHLLAIFLSYLVGEAFAFCRPLKRAYPAEHYRYRRVSKKGYLSTFAEQQSLG
jgi:hypothetical protein